MLIVECLMDGSKNDIKGDSHSPYIPPCDVPARVSPALTSYRMSDLMTIPASVASLHEQQKWWSRG